MVYTQIKEKVYIPNKNLKKMPRFLACSGGGDKGLMQIGMLLELYHECGKSSIAYDEMAGISAGAFTCACMSQVTPDTFEPTIQALISYFSSDTIKITKPWIGGGSIFNFIDACLYHTSLYSNTNMNRMLHKWYDPSKVKIPFSVGCFNKSLAQYESFSSHCHDMYRICLASSAIPVILPEVQIGPYVYQDGGMRHIIPIPEIKEWIQRTKGKKHIDVLVCFPIHNIHLFTKMTIPVFTFPIFNKAMEMVSNLMLEQLQNDLLELSNILQRPIHDITKEPCGEFMKGDLTIRILSPRDGQYHSITSMNKRRNKKLFTKGKSIVHTFLKI